MTRSIWKGPNVEVVHRTNRRIKQKKVINIKTHRVVQHGGQSVPIFFYPPTEVPLGTSAYRASLRERSSDIRASDSNRRHSSSTLDDRLHLCKRNWRQLWNIVNSFGVSPSAVVFPTGKQSRGGFRQPCRAVFPPQRGEKWTPRSGESPQSGAINWAPPSALKVVRTSSQGFSSPRYQTVFGRYSRESSDEGSPHLDCFRPEGAKTTGALLSKRGEWTYNHSKKRPMLRAISSQISIARWSTSPPTSLCFPTGSRSSFRNFGWRVSSNKRGWKETIFLSFPPAPLGRRGGSQKLSTRANFIQKGEFRPIGRKECGDKKTEVPKGTPLRGDSLLRSVTSERGQKFETPQGPKSTRTDSAAVRSALLRNLPKGNFALDSFLPEREKTSGKRKEDFHLLRETKENIIEEWSRRSTILPEFIGKKFAIHNGKGFFSKTIKENMIGHLFGEFSFTKTRAIYKSKRNKKKKSMSKSKS